jgi:hypothetical protein
MVRENLSATFAADRAFPGAVAEMENYAAQRMLLMLNEHGGADAGTRAACACCRFGPAPFTAVVNLECYENTRQVSEMRC